MAETLSRFIKLSRNPWARRVVLLSMPRTGSTMITRQLSTHPRVFFVGALFSVEGWLGEGAGRKRIRDGLSPEWNDLAYRVQHHRELLDHCYGLAGESTMFGYKHHLSGATAVTETAVADATTSKILLTRENVLACYSSNKMVEVKRSDGSARLEKATFLPEQFEQYVRIRQRVYERWKDRILTSLGPKMLIDYSEARTETGMVRIADFLGFDFEDLSPQRTAKRNLDNVAERFQNAAEVRAYLISRGLQSWEHERLAE